MTPVITNLVTDIPDHYQKTFDIALKHMEAITSILTLVIAAMAYLATKQLLEAPKAQRPSTIWLVLPSLPCAAVLYLTLSSYSKMEDSLSMKQAEDFIAWWQYARLGILSLLVVAVLMLAVSFFAFDRR